MTRQERFQEKAGALAGLGLAVAGTLALCLFAWLLVAGLSGQRRFTTWSAIAVYYVVPAAVAVLLFASLRLKPAGPIGPSGGRCVVHRLDLRRRAAPWLSPAVNRPPHSPVLDTQLQLQPVMTRLLRSSEQAATRRGAGEGLGPPD